MGLFDKIFKSKTTEISNSIIPKTEAKPNFDALVAKARTSGDASDLSLLYRAFFQLEEWTFIVSNNCTLENAKPFIGLLEEKAWLYVFTDTDKADQYAKQFANFLTKDGNTLVIKMSRDSSLNMIKQLNDRGVSGLRINEGENGWFDTIQGLFEIKDYLKIV